MNFSFQKPLGALDAPDFNFPLVRATDASIKDAQWILYFSNFFRFLVDAIDLLPRKPVERYFDPLAQMKWVMSVRACQIKSLFADLKLTRPLATAFWNSRNALTSIGFRRFSILC